MPSAEKKGQMTLPEFSEESSGRISVVRKDALEMLELDGVFSRRGGQGGVKNCISKGTKGRSHV